MMRLYLLLLITPGIVLGLQMGGGRNLALRVDELGIEKDAILQKLVQHLTSGASIEYNFLYVNCMGSVPCSERTCESYTLQGLGERLRSRGELLVNSDIYLHPSQNPHTLKEARIFNAAINSADIFIVKTTFNLEHEEIVKMIRKYNKRCYIAIICDGDEQFKLLKSMLLSNDIFNIYIFKPFSKNKNDLTGRKLSMGSKHSGGYLLYEVCAYCRNGKHELKFCNVWDYSKGFRKSVMFSPSFKGNFNNATIKVGIKHPSPSWMFALGITTEGKTKWGGRSYWFLKAISKFLNFKLETVNPKDGIICASSNSTWKGLCKLLIDRNVILSWSAGIVSWRYQFFEPSSVYLITANSIISASPPLTPQSISVVGSINKYVMIFLFVSYVSLTITLWRAKKYYYTDEKSTFANSALCLLSILFFESTNFTGNRFKVSEMLLVGAWSVCCVFAISSVFGEMTSASVAKPSPAFKPIDNFEDMAANGASWITPPTFKSPEYLPRKKLPHLIQKSKKMGVKDGLDYVLKHPTKYVYYFITPGIIPIIRSYFWDGTGPSPFHISSDTGDPPYLVVGLLTKGSPYTDDVTKATLQVEAAGLYLHKFEPDGMDALSKFGELSKPTADMDKQQYFTLEKMTGALVPLIIGVTLSLLVFTGELVEFRIRKKFHGKNVKSIDGGMKSTQ